MWLVCCAECVCMGQLVDWLMELMMVKNCGVFSVGSERGGPYAVYEFLIEELMVWIFMVPKVWGMVLWEILFISVISSIPRFFFVGNPIYSNHWLKCFNVWYFLKNHFQSISLSLGLRFLPLWLLRVLFEIFFSNPQINPTCTQFVVHFTISLSSDKILETNHRSLYV